MTALGDVARSFFVEANEASLVRHLCFALGCLPETEVDFLRVSVADAGSYVLASTSSELLSASEAGAYTKYQSLFLADASGEEARRKFFLRLNHLRRDTLRTVRGVRRMTCSVHAALVAWRVNPPMHGSACN